MFASAAVGSGCRVSRGYSTSNSAPGTASVTPTRSRCSTSGRRRAGTAWTARVPAGARAPGLAARTPPRRSSPARRRLAWRSAPGAPLAAGQWPASGRAGEYACGLAQWSTVSAGERAGILPGSRIGLARTDSASRLPDLAALRRLASRVRRPALARSGSVRLARCRPASGPEAQCRPASGGQALGASAAVLSGIGLANARISSSNGGAGSGTLRRRTATASGSGACRPGCRTRVGRMGTTAGPAGMSGAGPGGCGGGFCCMAPCCTRRR